MGFNSPAVQHSGLRRVPDNYRSRAGGDRRRIIRGTQNVQCPLSSRTGRWSAIDSLLLERHRSVQHLVPLASIPTLELARDSRVAASSDQISQFWAEYPARPDVCPEGNSVLHVALSVVVPVLPTVMCTMAVCNSASSVAPSAAAAFRRHLRGAAARAPVPSRVRRRHRAAVLSGDQR